MINLFIFCITAVSSFITNK